MSVWTVGLTWKGEELGTECSRQSTAESGQYWRASRGWSGKSPSSLEPSGNQAVLGLPVCAGNSQHMLKHKDMPCMDSCHWERDGKTSARTLFLKF